MLKTTHPAPRAQADALLSLTEAMPQLSLDVAEHPQDAGQYLYTWFLPQELKEQLTQALSDNGLRITNLTFENVDDTVDYVALTRANFPPLHIGPFFITRNDEEAPADTIALSIAPNRAFGSGEHATTTGCLLAYLNLKEQGETFTTGLDFGAGSGILAIAAAKRDGTPFLCIDNDAPSVQINAQNAQENGVESLITCQLGEAPPNQPFNLVFANILLQPLLELAPALAACTAKGGALILSGFTEDQAPQIEAAYSIFGLTKTWQHEKSGWLAQTWRK